MPDADRCAQTTGFSSEFASFVPHKSRATPRIAKQELRAIFLQVGFLDPRGELRLRRYERCYQLVVGSDLERGPRATEIQPPYSHAPPAEFRSLESGPAWPRQKSKKP